MTIGTFANGDSGSSIRTKLNSAIGILDGTTAKTWTAAQTFAQIAGGTDTSATPGTTITLTIDGKAKDLTLTDNLTITLQALSGKTNVASLIRVKQHASAAKTLSWAGSPVALGSQDLSTTLGSYSVWIAWTIDGGTTWMLTPGGTSA